MHVCMYIQSNIHVNNCSERLTFLLNFLNAHMSEFKSPLT